MIIRRVLAVSLAVALNLGTSSAFANVVGVRVAPAPAGAQAGAVGALGSIGTRQTGVPALHSGLSLGSALPGSALISPMTGGLRSLPSVVAGRESANLAVRPGVTASPVASVRADGVASVAAVAPAGRTKAPVLRSVRSLAGKLAPGKGSLGIALRSAFDGTVFNTGSGGRVAAADSWDTLEKLLRARLYQASRRSADDVWRSWIEKTRNAELKEEHTELIVRLHSEGGGIDQDLHESDLGLGQDYQRAYKRFLEGIKEQLKAAGVSPYLLLRYKVKPVATYKRINTATFRLPKSEADGFRKAMELQDHEVFENEKREIVRPIEDEPGYEPSWPWDPAVTIDETLKLAQADEVKKVAEGRWGPSGGLMGWVATKVLKLFGVEIPQPKIGFIDTGVDSQHKMIKQVLKAAKDIKPDGDGKDKDGHGTWVTSMAAAYDPWLRGVTHYKAFYGGSATTDDVLRALTMSANDDNIIMSNSWGDSTGDPKGPDSELVRKLGEEGRIMFFAAGNSYRRDTIGSPAIVHYRAPKTDTPRVIAVASTDRKMKTSSFSSKGPGSYITSRDYEDYPRKPEAAEEGSSTEGAWPTKMRGSRVDPKYGNVRAISGTSMSTPKLAMGTALLAQLFGVTKVGAELDKVVDALMATLVNPKGEPEHYIGDGFAALKAAYDLLVSQGLKPMHARPMARAAIWLANRLGGR